jgi:hypothetical protein
MADRISQDRPPQGAALEYPIGELTEEFDGWGVPGVEASPAEKTEPLRGRTMPAKDLAQRLESILEGQRILEPAAADIFLAGAIDALSAASGSGWTRQPVPRDRLIDILRGGPDAYAQQILGAYSVFEGAEGTPRQRLFFELRELFSSKDHPLRGFYSSYYSALADWVRSSLRNNEEIPGGVLNIRLKNKEGFSRDVYYFSDLHGNAKGLWRILNMQVSFNETLLEAMYLDKAVLLLGGDGWLPFYGNGAALAMGLTTLDALLLLTSELAGNFFWKSGNHDPLIRPPEMLTGGERLTDVRNALIQLRGAQFLFDVQQAVDRLPNLSLIEDDYETVAFGGHTPVADITPEQAVLSAFDPAVRRRLIFGTPYPQNFEAVMAQMRRSMKAPNAAFLSGHIHPKGDSRSAFRPTPSSRGIIVFRAYGQNISGAKISSHSPTRVLVEKFVGDEKTRLHGLDLRAEVLKANSQPPGVMRRIRSFFRNPKVNYAGLPPVEVLAETWVEGIKFLLGKMKKLFSRRPPVQNVNNIIIPQFSTANAQIPVPAAPLTMPGPAMTLVTMPQAAPMVW